MEWSHKQSLVLITGLVILIFICGCTSAPEYQSARSPSAGYGSPGYLEKISFGDVIEMIEDDPEYLALNGSRLCQVTGSGVDLSGNATSWMLGFCNENGNQLLVCDMHGWRQMKWAGVLPDDEIDLSQIVSPEELYARAAGPLAAAMKASGVEEGNLSLSGREYTVTLISDGKLNMLYFDAFTGEEVSST